MIRGRRRRNWIVETRAKGYWIIFGIKGIGSLVLGRDWQDWIALGYRCESGGMTDFLRCMCGGEDEVESLFCAELVRSDRASPVPLTEYIGHQKCHSQPLEERMK